MALTFAADIAAEQQLARRRASEQRRSAVQNSVLHGDDSLPRRPGWCHGLVLAVEAAMRGARLNHGAPKPPPAESPTPQARLQAQQPLGVVLWARRLGRGIPRPRIVQAGAAKDSI